MAKQLTSSERKKLELVKLRQLLQGQLDECLDADDLESRPSGAQLSFLQDEDSEVIWIVSANRSGKTQTWVRAITWWFQGKHPYVSPPKSWGDKFNILVVGRTLEILETEIWEKKIRPLLPLGSYSTIKKGQSLTGVLDNATGNKILFMSHHDAKNAREKVQGFTAPIIALDEMPDDSGLVSELIMRTATIKGAKFIGAFTPLVENEQVRKIVDSSGTRYTFKPEDNPKLMDRFGGIEEYDTWLRAQCATEAEYRARRYGEWYYRSGRVVAAYDVNRDMRPLPPTYHPHHNRHVAVVDPAAVGLVGVTIWADIGEGRWQCVYAKKHNGDAAYNLVKELEAVYKDYNVVERRCDPNPAGFYKEALRQGIPYIPVADKQDRKWETIEQVNAAFSKEIICLSPAALELADECLQAKVSEANTNKIIASSSWHLIDCLRYFVDNIPTPLATARVFKNERHALKQKHMEVREERTKKMIIIQKRQNRWAARQWKRV